MTGVVRRDGRDTALMFTHELLNRPGATRGRHIRLVLLVLFKWV